MIWNPDRNAEYGRLVTAAYDPAAAVPCERSAIMVGGLPRTDRLAAAQSGADSSRPLRSVNATLPTDILVASRHFVAADDVGSGACG